MTIPLLLRQLEAGSQVISDAEFKNVSERSSTGDSEAVERWFSQDFACAAYRMRKNYRICKGNRGMCA